tara:strand:+ start:274 stop:564 length:291 start_codon:yes stop_codon:yes gene_type:complete
MKAIIKMGKSAGSTIKTFYKSNIIVRGATKVAGIFAIAGLEVKSKEWWEDRSKKAKESCDPNTMSYGDLCEVVKEQKETLNSLKSAKRRAYWSGRK